MRLPSPTLVTHADPWLTSTATGLRPTGTGRPMTPAVPGVDADHRLVAVAGDPDPVRARVQAVGPAGDADLDHARAFGVDARHRVLAVVGDPDIAGGDRQAPGSAPDAQAHDRHARDRADLDEGRGAAAEDPHRAVGGADVVDALRHGQAADDRGAVRIDLDEVVGPGGRPLGDPHRALARVDGARLAVHEDRVAGDVPGLGVDLDDLPLRGDGDPQHPAPRSDVRDPVAQARAGTVVVRGRRDAPQRRVAGARDPRAAARHLDVDRPAGDADRGGDVRGHHGGPGRRGRGACRRRPGRRGRGRGRRAVVPAAGEHDGERGAGGGRRGDDHDRPREAAQRAAAARRVAPRRRPPRAPGPDPPRRARRPRRSAPRRPGRRPTGGVPRAAWRAPARRRRRRRRARRRAAREGAGATACRCAQSRASSVSRGYGTCPVRAKCSTQPRA